MTREEEIDKIASAFAIDEVKDTCNPASKRGLLYVGFVTGAEWADSHPHWISVEEELPPKRSKYDYFSVNVLATDGKEIYESVYNHDSEDWFTHDLWGLDNITHWMPLPQPPVLSNSVNTGKKGGEE